MISCIIIDDEPRARNLLAAIIAHYCPQLSVEASCEDLPSGIKAIRKHQPQLVFLDIELPGHSGLELLDFFNDDEINFSVIFTTAYNEYALQAFKFSAIDYLLKPIQHQQLSDAVARFEKQHAVKATGQLRTLQQNLNGAADWENKRIVVPIAQSLKFIKPCEIIMLKGEAAYSEFYLIDGSTFLASRNLKHFEEALAHVPFFMRCHKSYLINTRCVAEYVKSDGGFLKMQGGGIAGISAERVEELLKRIR